MLIFQRHKTHLALKAYMEKKIRNQWDGWPISNFIKKLKCLSYVLQLRKSISVGCKIKFQMLCRGQVFYHKFDYK